MSIREKRTSISQFAAALRQRSSQDKRDLLVADTLDSLCRHCDLYDAARVSSNPFHPELLRAIWTTRKRSCCSSSNTAGNGCLTT